MAEEKKSIEISYKANLKDLVSKLKTLPNVTGQEAKKMVAELDRQLKQAERAAKKSADAQKKAAKAAAAAARRGGQSFKDMADSANDAKEKIGEVGEQAGDVDRGFSAIGLALRAVNPELAEAADGLADASAVTEGLAMSFKGLNPLVIGAGLAIGAVTLAYTHYHKEAEKAKQLTIDMREATKSLSGSLRSQRDNLLNSFEKLRDMEDQLDHTTGKMSDFDFALSQAGKSAAAQFESNIQSQKDIIQQREDDLSLIERLQKGQFELSEAEKERLRTLQLQVPNVDKNLDLTKKSGKVLLELVPLYDAIENNLNNQNKVLKQIEDNQSQSVELAKQKFEFEHEQTQEKERQLDIDKKAAEAAEDRLEAELEVQKIINSTTDAEKTFQAKQELELSLVKLRETEHEKAIREIEERFKADEQRLKKLALISGEEFTHQITIAELRLRKEQEIHELSLKNREQLKELDEEIIKDLIGDLGTIASDLEMIYSNLFINQKNVVAERQKEREEFDKLSQMEQDRITRQKKIMTAFFRAEQALSIADIGMSTAEAVMKAQAVYGPGTPQAIAASILAVATGATQSAVVASKQPPSFHMGGLAPDEMGARVLRGEAILDRATVRRIGGEQGVKQLQQQGSDRDQVVIIQPFRHFGRFAREIGFTSPKNTGIKAY